MEQSNRQIEKQLYKAHKLSKADLVKLRSRVNLLNQEELKVQSKIKQTKQFVEKIAVVKTL